VTVAFSALSAVSQGIYTVLNVPAFLALARFGDAIPQATQFPFLLVDVDEHFMGGMGTKPGASGALYKVNLALHAYGQGSTTEGPMKQCQTVIAKAIELLTDPPAVSGFASCAIFHDETIKIGDETVGGQLVKEVVTQHRLMVVLA
jgi:hypothetical protein